MEATSKTKPTASNTEANLNLLCEAQTDLNRRLSTPNNNNNSQNRVQPTVQMRIDTNSEDDTDMNKIVYGINALNVSVQNLSKNEQKFWNANDKVIAVCLRPMKKKLPRNSAVRNFLVKACTEANTLPFEDREYQHIYAVWFLTPKGIGIFSEKDKYEEKSESQKLVFESSMAYLQSKNVTSAKKLKLENCIHLQRPVPFQPSQNQGFVLIDHETITQIMIDPEIIAHLPSQCWPKISWWVSIALHPICHNACYNRVKLYELRVSTNKYVNFASKVCVYMFTE